MKKLSVISLIYIVIMCMGCGNNLQSDNSSEEERTTWKTQFIESSPKSLPEIPEETIVPAKPIDEYEDCRAIIDPEILMEISEDGAFVRFPKWETEAPIYDWEPPYNVKETAERASIVIVGKVLDVMYSDQVITESGNHAATFYSFAVSQVVKGEEISPETIITVMEYVGYIRRSVQRYASYSNIEYPVPDDKVYYVLTHAGEPLVQVGDEYVLFLEPGKVDHVDGNLYVGQLSYAGKYTKNEEGLYEKYIWEYGYFAPRFYWIDEEAGERKLIEPPMTLEELLKAIEE